MTPLALDGGTVLDGVPIFPLPNTVFFPSSLLPLQVFEPRYLEMVSDVLEGNLHLGIVRLQPGWEPHYYGSPPVHRVFGLGEIVKIQELPDGRRNILLRGVARLQIEEELRVPSSYRQVRAKVLADQQLEAKETELQRTLVTLRQLFSEIVRRVEDLDLDVMEALFSAKSGAGSVIDAMASIIPLQSEDRQELLEHLDLCDRATLLCRLFTDFLDSKLEDVFGSLRGKLPPGYDPAEG